MCGRVVQAKGPLQVAIQCGIAVPDTRFANVPPRYNAAPSQDLWAIRQNNDWASPCGVEGSVRNPSTPGGWYGRKADPKALYARV